MIEIKKGQIVKSRAGHDKESFFVVVEARYPYALICDGKRRKLKNPKKKKQMHLAPTKTTVSEASLETDKRIREALRDSGER